MPHNLAGIASTQHVEDEQTRHGSRRQYERVQRFGPDNDRAGPDEKSFIESRDGMYLATVSETGWPYLQFRGGPKGFLRALDEQMLGFADFRGNRQYITVGDLRANDRVASIPHGLPKPDPAEDLGPGRAEGSGHRPGACQRPDRAGLPRYRRTSRAHSRRCLRLELPAAHHTPLDERGGCGSKGPVRRRVAELEAEYAALLRQQLERFTPPMSIDRSV